MAGEAAILAAAGAAMAGVAVLRLSWGRPQRSAALNAAGWAVLGAGAGLSWIAAGAWGMAVAMLAATAAAGLALARSAAETPRGGRRAAPLANDNAPLAAASGWGRGLVTFLITGPLALMVAVAAALALRALMLRAGAPEADGNVLVLGLVPLGWAILTSVLLLTARRAHQGALLAGTAGTAAFAFLLTGAFA